ncbi:MAG TPA: Chromate resistance protein ChrB [Dehalococcoidia bacterium]|nr:Chromate resistance protein ChrB [Dehalococcoidia bacterium]
MDRSARWVLLAYRLPREPSTPRITLWRKLRRLGAVQILDGLVGLPLDARTREQFEWLADEVLEAGGEASLWLGSPAGAAQERTLIGSMNAELDAEYRALIAAARAAATEPVSSRRRTLGRLRREFRRIAARDYFPAPGQAAARDAVEALAVEIEVRR